MQEFNFVTCFTEFQKRVLYQLAILTREVGDLKKMLDRRIDDNQTTDLAVAEGPLQTVAAVEALDQNCGDSSTKQFLASIGPWLVANACTCYSNDGSIIKSSKLRPKFPYNWLKNQLLDIVPSLPPSRVFFCLVLVCLPLC